ncbi:MAG: alpha/beta hydrolase [Pseudomonadota bacterium]|nr:alpha/beta hydrolase [Pseudomonadota bacterium]
MEQAPAKDLPDTLTQWTEMPSLGTRMHSRAWLNAAGPGTAPPIVLVHGLGLSSRSMTPLGRRLAALGYQVVAPDMPGFGRSPRPAGSAWPAGPNVREQADQLLAWMDARGIDRAILIGNSVGVQVCVEVAVRFPQRVAQLILVGPTPDPRYRSMLKQYPLVLQNQLYEVPSLNDVFMLEYASAGPARMMQQGVRTVGDPIEERLPMVEMPALVVRGEHDKTMTQDWAERFAAMMPNGRLVVVDRAAHNVQYSAPHVLARLVQKFLEGGLEEAAASSEQVVVTGPDAADPLARPQPIPTALKAVGDYVGSALCLTVPRALDWGPRTQRALAVTGVTGAALALFTDYEGGAVRKIPMTLHLNLDALKGMALLDQARRARGEPAAGRVAMALIGGYKMAAALLTRKPMGPARLVP